MGIFWEVTGRDEDAAIIRECVTHQGGCPPQGSRPRGRPCGRTSWGWRGHQQPGGCVATTENSVCCAVWRVAGFPVDCQSGRCSRHLDGAGGSHLEEVGVGDLGVLGLEGLEHGHGVAEACRGRGTQTSREPFGSFVAAQQACRKTRLCPAACVQASGGWPTHRRWRRG